ncbi:RNA polymerase factor sigma-32 [Myxococcota bacterium]|nr:RNA polymerase factor sigma-32 [Myxococcota bacterium]
MSKIKRSGADDLSTYMGQVSAYGLLTREEEYQLALRWRDQQDPEAARLLVLSNLRAVVKIAGEFRSYHANFADLVQEGNMGLIRALDRYDPDRGTRFLSYAGWWIRACIKEYLLRTRSLVRIGTTQKQRIIFSRLGRAKAEIEDSDLSQEERWGRLAEMLGVDIESVKEMEGRLSGYDLSLDQPIEEGSGGASYLDMVPDTETDVEGHAIVSQAKDVRVTAIAQAMETLTERERKIIRRRYLDDESETLKDIGKQLGISRERVRQIELKAREKMRRSLESTPLGAEIAAEWAAISDDDDGDGGGDGDEVKVA